jgi:peptide/nickel transport system substrate-binding protein
VRTSATRLQGDVPRPRRRRAAAYRHVVGLLLGSTSVVFAAGCGDAKTSATAGKSAMIINMVRTPHSLDPANQCDAADPLAGNLYSRLVQFGTKPGPDGTLESDQTKLEPDLARSWDVSHDGRTYTFHLRSGAKFGSGRPVDAEAVVYNFDRVQKMGVCSAFAVSTADNGNVRSVRALDPTTVEIKLRRPNSSLIRSWATPSLGIVDPSVVEAHGGVVAGKPNEYLATHDAGSGPFIIKRYQPNQSLVLVSNPTYYGPKPKTTQLTVNFVSADSTLQLQASNGTADVTIGLSKQGYNSLRSNSKVRRVAYTARTTEQVVLNWDKAPFDQVLVRRAVATAVPYDALISKVTFGLGKAFYGPILPGMPFYNAPLSQPLATDVAKAKDLIQQSGVKTPIRVTLVIDQGNQIHEQLATLLQDTWNQIGLKVSIRKLDQAAYTDTLFGNKAQATLRTDFPFVDDPDYYLGYDLQCQKGAENTGHICVPSIDRALLRARRALSDGDKQHAYDEVTRLWRDNAPKVFLYLEQDTVVLSRRVGSFTFDPTLSSFARLGAK